MGKTGIGADRAYELMNQMSQDKNLKVHAIALDIINRATSPGGDPTADRPHE
ncbi:ANTAR domain-containing protein [Propionicicella superfundia]|uniref:ANTAR domain-containing protein n=1 Tax=Propionicicella superfundia TaxID=348582 RepID=UPI001B7FA853